MKVMRLTDEALKEFEILLRQDYPDEALTPEQIREMATRVMRAVELVYQPILPKERRKKHQIKSANPLRSLPEL